MTRKGIWRVKEKISEQVYSPLMSKSGLQSLEEREIWGGNLGKESASAVWDRVKCIKQKPRYWN